MRNPESKWRRKRWLLAASAVLAALVAGNIVMSRPAEATPRAITGGYLDWGVKEGFRNYVQGPIANGSITLSGGATQNGDGTFRFPAVATGNHDGFAGTTTSAYDGSVYFYGHAGALEMTISDIRVDLDGDTGVLVADVVSRSLETGQLENYPDTNFADLDLTGTPANEAGATVSWSAIPATLTEDGVAAFADFYPAGTPLDPVNPTLDLEAIGDLTWKVSQHAWTSSSLAPAHAAGAPAIKDPVNGFVFPAYDVLSYDRITGATDVEFEGSLTLGNIMQGGYRITLANPHIIIDSDNDGVLEADVSYCVSTAACAGPWVGPVADVTITTFDTDPLLITDTGSHVSWTFTPHWATVGNQFAQEFLDTLDSSLRAHFRASGSGSDPNKPPAPITVQFDYDCPSAPSADANFVDNAPYVVDDATWINSDAAGNNCDGDDDNDGLTDAQETAPPCASATAPTDPEVRDSDGDRILDGPECMLSADPMNVSSKPTFAQCAAHLGVTVSTDTDGDRVKDGVEFCAYNSNPATNDTDGDATTTGSKDGCEVASLNTDRIVNVGDMGMLAAEISRAVPVSQKLANFDLNKDGVFNPADQGTLASFIAPGGQCP